MMELSEWVEEFVRQQAGPFPIGAVAEYVEEKMGLVLTKDELTEFMMAFPLTFDTDEDDHYIPRSVFFRGTQLRVTPSAEEVKGGYLVPGHRFMPFCSRAVFPPDAELIQEEGTALPTRVLESSMSEIQRYFAFYSESETMEYLVSDDDGNAAVLMNPESEDDLYLNVFDFTDFYRKHHFQPGDSLMLRVESWERGRFSVEYVDPEAPVFLGDIQLWVQALRSNLEFVLMDLETEADCYEQFAQMLNLSVCDLEALRNPPLSLAAFANQLKESVVVKRLGDSVLFWPVDEDPMENAYERVTQMDEDDLQNMMTDFERVCLENGLPGREDVLEGYMRDAHFRNLKSPLVLLEELAGGRALLFDSEDDQSMFEEAWQDLWNVVECNYLPLKDVSTGPVRQDALAVLEVIRDVFTQLEARQVMPQDLERNDSLAEVMQLHTMFMDLVSALNAPDAEASFPVFEEMVQMAAEAKKIAKALAEELLSMTD